MKAEKSEKRNVKSMQKILPIITRVMTVLNMGSLTESKYQIGDLIPGL